MNINEYIQKNRGTAKSDCDWLTPRVVCADGFVMSVQASDGNYCSPRTTDSDHYASVEIGYPSEASEIINQYAEDPESPIDTVYPYVPVEVVDELIESHGGFKVENTQT